VQLSLSDLQEIDAERIGPLSCEQPRQLLGKTVANLIKARERLNQNSRNSPMPAEQRVAVAKG